MTDRSFLVIQLRIPPIGMRMGCANANVRNCASNACVCICYWGLARVAARYFSWYYGRLASLGIRCQEWSRQSISTNHRFANHHLLANAHSTNPAGICATMHLEIDKYDTPLRVWVNSPPPRRKGFQGLTITKKGKAQSYKTELSLIGFRFSEIPQYNNARWSISY